MNKTLTSFIFLVAPQTLLNLSLDYNNNRPKFKTEKQVTRSKEKNLTTRWKIIFAVK